MYGVTLLVDKNGSPRAGASIVYGVTLTPIVKDSACNRFDRYSRVAGPIETKTIPVGGMVIRESNCIFHPPMAAPPPVCDSGTQCLSSSSLASDFRFKIL